MMCKFVVQKNFSRALQFTLVFCAIAWCRSTDFVLMLDRYYYAKALVPSASSAWILFWEAVSLLGNGWCIYPVLILVLYTLSQRLKINLRPYLGLLGFLILALLSNAVLKKIFHLPRPVSLSPYTDLTSYTFPSGHSFNAVLACFFFPQFLKQFMKIDLYQNKFFAITAALILVMIATSRVLLGAHWVSDVVGGVVWGFAASYFLLCYKEQP